MTYICYLSKFSKNQMFLILSPVQYFNMGTYVFCGISTLI